MHIVGLLLEDISHCNVVTSLEVLYAKQKMPSKNIKKKLIFLINEKDQIYHYLL